MNLPRLVILTGRSDPARTGLPVSQAAFLDAVTPSGLVANRDGYPWIGGPPEAPVSLLLAAWRNALQWRAAHIGTARAEVSMHLRKLGRGPLAIITGSCGLDMLSCGWQDGSCRLVIALGPVMAKRPTWPSVRIVTVIGQRDLLSRAIHRSAPDIRVPCGHMGYWACLETRAAVASVLKDWTP